MLVKNNFMERDQSSHGFGLGVFGLLLLASAYLVMFNISNPIFAALLGLLSAIIGAAAYLEARRANGPKKFAMTVMLLAVLGTLFILARAGLTDSASPVNDFRKTEMELIKEKDDLNRKIEELEKKLEKLEEEN
jgi:thiol:disulfide interchange protein